jgi:hypothetical protein
MQNFGGRNSKFGQLTALKATRLRTSLLLGTFFIAFAWVPAGAGSLVDISAAPSDAGDHLVRRCKSGSKQEYCYWTKVGTRPEANR